MKTQHIISLLLLVGCCTVSAQTTNALIKTNTPNEGMVGGGKDTRKEPPRPNILTERFGGPYHDLPVSSQAAVENFGVQLLKACGPANGIWKERGALNHIFKSVMIPSLTPLKTGNASEKKVFEAALTIEKAWEYAGDNIIDNGSWDDQTLNKLLRLNGKPSDSEAIFSGLSDLTTDFLQIAGSTLSEQE
jgi:hypothetical protein